MITCPPYADISVQEENAIDDIVTNLYRRVAEETDKLLRSQLEALGVDITDVDEIAINCQKRLYPDYSNALATYHYKGRLILGIRKSDNGMCIDFDIPNLNAQQILDGQCDETEMEMTGQGVDPESISRESYGEIKCNHDMQTIYQGGPGDGRPTGQRCSKCGHTEWF